MKTILSVENDPDYHKRYCRNLREAGYRVREADNTADMVDAVRRERPDLIVLNASIEQAGEVVDLQEVKEIDRTIPIVLHTNSSLYENDIRYALVDACVTKSANPELLRQVIDELMEQQKSKR